MATEVQYSPNDSDNSLNDQSPSAVQTPPQNSTQPNFVSSDALPPKKRSIPKWIKVFLVVIACLIIFITASFVLVEYGTKEAQAVSDKFVNSIQDGDSAIAYSLTTSSFQNATTQSQLNTLINRISPHLKGEEQRTGKKIYKSAGRPSQAVVLYSVETTNGENFIRVVLEEDNGSWKVLNFRSSETPLELTLE